MLTILGRSSRRNEFCDGASRRDFLKIGGLTMGGLTLPQLLRAESQSGIGRSHKAIINIFLPGGPPHQDMWDLKPNAPSEIRGDFDPISTSTPGIQIGRHYIQTALRTGHRQCPPDTAARAGNHYGLLVPVHR